MLRSDVVGAGRAEALSNFPFDHTVVLHEMGVTPIHTTAEELEKACKQHKKSAKYGPLRERLFIMHCKAGDGLAAGFRQADDYDTIRLNVQSGELSANANPPTQERSHPDNYIRTVRRLSKSMRSKKERNKCLRVRGCMVESDN